MIPTHKIGDTFSWGGTYAATDAAGQPVDVSGATATAQLRTPSGSLISDLVVTKGAGIILLRNNNTQGWPTGAAQLDVQFVLPSGDKISTATATINLVPDVTQP